MRRGKPRASTGGFTYLGLLALIALIGLMLAGAATVTRMAVQRAHETELLWIGREYRAAIGRYVNHYHRFPPTLAALLGPTATGAASDEGQPAAPVGAGFAFRALRRLYRDPMTNSMEWTTVPSADGAIMGVASSSPKAPIKVAGFEKDEEDFEKAETYADWVFVYSLPVYARRPAVPARPN